MLTVSVERLKCQFVSAREGQCYWIKNVGSDNIQSRTENNKFSSRKIACMCAICEAIVVGGGHRQCQSTNSAARSTAEGTGIA